jgi:hypothetical protein
VFGLIGAGVGAAVGSPTVMDFEDAPATVNPVECAPLVPALAHDGAEIHAGPDTGTEIIAKLRATTPVCAATRSQGFGLRRVKLPDGREGFIKDSNLSE